MKTLKINPKQFESDLLAVSERDNDGHVEIEITNHFNGGRNIKYALAYLDHAEQIELRDFLDEQIKGVNSPDAESPLICLSVVHS